MMAIRVFDPPSCCFTGVCGPSVAPDLARFAADLEWLSGQGVVVERYNLAQHPQAFVEEAAVRRALEPREDGCLPVIVRDGEQVPGLCEGCGLESPGRRATPAPQAEEAAMKAQVFGTKCAQRRSTPRAGL